MNIHNNYSLANCTKNFMTFCAKFLLTRKIICAILEPQKENKTDRRTSRKGNKKMTITEMKEYLLEELKEERNKMLMNKENHYSYIFMICNDMGIIEE